MTSNPDIELAPFEVPGTTNSDDVKFPPKGKITESGVRDAAFYGSNFGRYESRARERSARCHTRNENARWQLNYSTESDLFFDTSYVRGGVATAAGCGQEIHDCR